jgi:hypothetical protein
MLTNEWTFIKIRAAEFELPKLCPCIYPLTEPAPITGLTCVYCPGQNGAA